MNAMIDHLSLPLISSYRSISFENSSIEKNKNFSKMSLSSCFLLYAGLDFLDLRGFSNLIEEASADRESYTLWWRSYAPETLQDKSFTLLTNFYSGVTNNYGNKNKNNKS